MDFVRNCLNFIPIYKLLIYNFKTCLAYISGTIYQKNVSILEIKLRASFLMESQKQSWNPNRVGAINYNDRHTFVGGKTC